MPYFSIDRNDRVIMIFCFSPFQPYKRNKECYHLRLIAPQNCRNPVNRERFVYSPLERRAGTTDAIGTASRQNVVPTSVPVMFGDQMMRIATWIAMAVLWWTASAEAQVRPELVSHSNDVGAGIVISLDDEASLGADQAEEPGKRYQPPEAPPGVPELNLETADAESMTGVTLDDLIQSATANNPTLRQASAQISATMGKAIQAGLYPNPTLRYSAEQIGVEGTPGEFHGGILSQEIVRGGKLRLSREKYLQRVQVAEALAVAQQFRVCNDVRTHYFDALALQEQIQIQRELLKTSEDAAVTTREAFQMGQANAADIRKSNVALQQARLKLMQLENQHQQIVGRLSALTGQDWNRAWFQGVLQGEPTQLTFDQLLMALYENSPELLAARCKLEADRITVQREQVEPIPNINLEGGAGYNFEARDTVAVAGVSIRLPLFDRNQGTVQQARADLSRQCAEIERLQARLKQDLADEYQRFLTAVQHQQQYEQAILPDLRETYRLLLDSYQDNRVGWTQVLAAQSDYYQARMDYIGWLQQWRRSETMLDGMLLHGGLMAAEGVTPAGHIDATPKPR